VSTNDFTLLDTPLAEFQPPESNFTISSISKGEKQYFRKVVREIEADIQDMNNDQASQLSSTYKFPMADIRQASLILHHPLEIWGYDNNQLILAVIT
jgi:hypothetical protein